MKIKNFCLLLLLFVSVNYWGISQTIKDIDINKINTIDFDKLSDGEIEKYLLELEKKGITIEQAIILAKSKGVPQYKIDKILQKIKNKDNKSVTKVEDKEVQPEEYSKKEEVEFTKKDSLIFGFNFFNNEKLNFTPDINVPVSKDYIIGYGDEIIIDVYGASEKTYNLTVSNFGNIIIPRLGPIKIAGLQLNQAQNLIKKKLVRIYSGSVGDNPNTNIQISLGNLKGIDVNVIGDVHFPGTFKMPHSSSVFTALYLAGGPNENGSFRKIDIIRNNKIIKSLDVYSYLINGKTENNIQLLNQDIVIVNPYLNRIELKGEFRRKGLFETKSGETVKDIVQYSGGFTTKAFTQNVTIDRNNGVNKSIVSSNQNNFGNTLLTNGDIITASEVIDKYTNKVTILGAVNKPGDYELNTGLKLSELVKKAYGFKKDVYVKRAIITRKKSDNTLYNEPFSVEDLISGKFDLDLKNEDVIEIASIFDLKEEQIITITGEVKFPGDYIYSDNLKLKDIIYKAGGFKMNADVTSIEVTRILNEEEIKTQSENILHTHTFKVDRDLKLSKEADQFILKPFDRVFVRYAPGFVEQGMVTIEGEVLYAGNYGITKKQERISDIIKRAGGLNNHAYLEGASLRRKIILTEAEIEAKKQLMLKDSTLNIELMADDGEKKNIDDLIKKEEYKIVGIDLKRILKNARGDDDLIVKDGDQINIPMFMQTVKVSGEVLSPVILTYERGNSLKKYIRMSGGYTQKANRGNVYVLYPNGTSATVKSFMFFRSFPKIIPGCEIIIPKKPEVDVAGNTAKWVSIATGLTSLATSIVAIISLTQKNN